MPSGAEDVDLFGEELVGEGGSMSHLNQHKIRMKTKIQMLLLRLVICLTRSGIVNRCN